MAKMYPARLPAYVESAAERRLFELFRTEFSDDFVVFYGVRWLAKRRRGAMDGEADFIVAHPRYGVLVIEVKGGGIGYDSATGKYTSTDRSGAVHEIKDPFQQASTSMHALISKVNESEVTAKHQYRYGYAVALPDVEVDFDLATNAPEDVIIDAEAVQDVKQSVIDIFRYWDLHQTPIGDDAVEALAGLLGRSWQVRTTVGADIAAQEEVIRLLTEKQFQLLDFLGARRRALITGCAGSGKTMLAVEKARRLAREGYRVLVTCYNQNLGDWLGTQLASDGVTAHRFLSLCSQYATRAGVHPEHRAGESENDFYSRLPDALCRALDVLPDRFDAIIVDEGQDFDEEWWVAVMSLLEDPDDGLLYIFYDDNQRLYERRGAFPIAEEPFHLPENCRNTKQIHEAVMVYYASDTQPLCLGPEGPEPKLHRVDPGEDEVSLVGRLIDDLVGNESVDPGDIAILTRRSRERSAWRNPHRREGWSATWELRDSAGKVLCSTVHAFKGLERPVVIVCELGGMRLDEEQEFWYVALSRARLRLYVFGLDGP